MGFDLYGENPVMRKISKDAYPVYDKYAGMDFKEQRTAFEKDTELKNQYYEEWTKRDKENPGTYFRNNVWWWRRLWQFVCEECDNILNEEDMAGGQSNDMHLITEDKAILLGKQLQEKIDNGIAKAFEDSVKEYCASVDKDKHGNPKHDDDFMANYPFLVSNLQEFTIFCSESGGFTIG